MNESLHFVGGLQYGVRDHVRANDVGFEKDAIVENGPRDMGLRGEVHDDIRSRHERIHNLAVGHVAVPELELFRFAHRRRKIVQIPRVGQRIEHDDPVIGTLMVEVANEVAADETGAAGHENCFHANTLVTMLVRCALAAVMAVRAAPSPRWRGTSPPCSAA